MLMKEMIMMMPDQDDDDIMMTMMSVSYNQGQLYCWLTIDRCYVGKVTLNSLER